MHSRWLLRWGLALALVLLGTEFAFHPRHIHVDGAEHDADAACLLCHGGGTVVQPDVGTPRVDAPKSVRVLPAATPRPVVASRVLLVSPKQGPPVGAA
jgi:hypothetical protein